MVDYEAYEEEIRSKPLRRKLKKMPKFTEDRDKGRKLNHRTKKNKVRE